LEGSKQKFKYALSTGNLGNKESFDWIKSISPPNNLITVKGETDKSKKDLAESRTINIFY
jgi:hypothetical protein